MVTPSAGDIVLVRFPFSDLSQSKLRPAVTLADAGHGDWVLCQITSNPYSDSLAVQLSIDDFLEGSLPVTSYARPSKLFTANQDLLISQVGHLKTEAFKRVIEAITDFLHASIPIE